MEGDINFVVYKVESFMEPFWYLKECTWYFFIMYKSLLFKKMAPGRTLTLGVDAIFTWLVRLIRPP